MTADGGLSLGRRRSRPEPVLRRPRKRTHVVTGGALVRAHPTWALAHADCSVDRLELRSIDADAVKNAGKNLAGINRQAIDRVAVVADDIANI